MGYFVLYPSQDIYKGLISTLSDHYKAIKGPLDMDEYVLAGYYTSYDEYGFGTIPNEGRLITQIKLYITGKNSSAPGGSAGWSANLKINDEWKGNKSAYFSTTPEQKSFLWDNVNICSKTISSLKLNLEGFNMQKANAATCYMIYLSFRYEIPLSEVYSEAYCYFGLPKVDTTWNGCPGDLFHYIIEGSNNKSSWYELENDDTYSLSILNRQFRGYDYNRVKVSIDDENWYYSNTTDVMDC